VQFANKQGPRSSYRTIHFILSEREVPLHVGHCAAEKGIAQIYLGLDECSVLMVTRGIEIVSRDFSRTSIPFCALLFWQIGVMAKDERQESKCKKLITRTYGAELSKDASVGITKDL
jgi:hypothetical protein